MVTNSINILYKYWGVLFILNIETNSDEEFNQTIQQYMMQDFHVESNIGDTCILKKKGYNKSTFWVLIILGILTLFLYGLGLILLIIALVYYIASKDEVVMINKKNASGNSSEAGNSPGTFCANCGAALANDAQFCAKCGFKVLN